MPNPLLGQELKDGATISFWVNRSTENDWDALFGLTDGTARLYMTGRTYVGYNKGTIYNRWKKGSFIATFFIFLSFIKCDNLAHSKHYEYLRYEHSEKHA
jgi:hypothetical protein